VEGQRSHHDFDVVGLGIAPLDMLGILPRYPSLDEKVEFAQTSVQGGGPVPTAMVTLARLGARVSFVGKIGQDSNGSLVKEGLEREGVDTGHLIIDPKAKTPVAHIWIESKTGKKTVALDRTDISDLQPKELDREHVTSCRFLHLDGRETEACLRAAQWARKKGVKVVLDLGSLRPKLEVILGLTDYLITSEGFARAYTGLKDPWKAAQALFQPCYQTVVVTLGERGSVGVSSSETIYQPSFKVKVVDTTGAGDVFHGAFIYSLLQNWDLSKALSFSNGVAALKCTKIGGRQGIPNGKEVEKLMRKNGEGETG
jgi:sulfofructose kinase